MMQSSKLSSFPLVEPSFVMYQDQIHHCYCRCEHCAHNTKPTSRPTASRHVSVKEKTMTNTKAYEFILKEMTKGYFGRCQVPDVFIVAQGSMIFQSKSQGRPKIREHQSNIQAKKHFQQQRKRLLGGSVAAHLSISSIFPILQDPMSNLSMPLNKSHKQVALLAYHDGTQQLLSQVLLGKTLDKRKNDPSWEGISYLQLIPPQIKHPIKKHHYHYIRSEDTLPQLKPFIDKLAEQLDTFEEKVLVYGTAGKAHLLKMQTDQEMELSVPNPEAKHVQNVMRKTRSTLYPKTVPSLLEITPQEVARISLQMVAYLQVTTFTRILQADLQFFTDDIRLYLSGVHNFIYEKLDKKELTLIHDRYQLLEEISLKDIAVKKKQNDEEEKKQLWNICAAVVKECLEFRKVQLKLETYKNPTQETLLKIFMKIFPQFKADDIFASINWKNQLGVFISKSRNTINKIIRQDQGIRILRRFGIEFRRTFH